jgi:hypothetical protein
MHMHNRRRSRLMAAGAVLGATGLVAAGVNVAQAATPSPPALSFVVASNTVIAYRYPSGGGEEGSKPQTDLDLGTHVIAGKDPLEIQVTRPDYSKPPVAKQAVWKKGRKSWVPLPAGMVTTFPAGLKAFTRITVTDAAGATVLDQDSDWCPNTWQPTRARPDAPDASPYPQACGSGSGENPFVLGNVWGLQAGWSAPASAGRDGTATDLPVGSYRATVAVNPVYRDFFKIPAGEATVTLALTVVDAPAGRPDAAVKGPDAGPRKDGHAEHGTEGDPNRQVSAYLPELRPAARRPESIADSATAASAPKGPRPDLRALPAWNVKLGPAPEQPDGRSYLSFAATVWNGGTSPLLVDGFRRTGTELMDAYQYFYDASGKQVGSAPAGTMEWDKRPGHMHWHFTDFAQYRLLGADKALVVKSGKEAFCLANTDAVDFTVPNAKWRPGNTDLGTSCGQNTSVATRQVLDIGNGDTYDQSLPGQSFDVTDLPNGTYYIEVAANPYNKLAEVSTTNNTSLREVVLGGTPDARTLTVPPYQGIVG